MALANRTLLTPAIADREAESPKLPCELAQFLQTVRERTIIRNSALQRQLIEAVQALTARDVKVVLIKGAAMLAESKHALANRIFADLDLLVSAADFDTATAALESIGYTNYPPLNSLRHGTNLCRETDVGGIDLHCTLKPKVLGKTFETIAPHCQAMALGSGQALIPSPAIQAAILILHDQVNERDYWRGLMDLRHLVDLKELSGRDADFDWEELTRFFPPGVARRALETQLETYALLFDLPAKASLTEGRISRWQTRRRLAQQNLAGLARFFTALTLILDPPIYYLGRLDDLFAAPRDRLRSLRRMFYKPKLNKL